MATNCNTQVRLEFHLGIPVLALPCGAAWGDNVIPPAYLFKPRWDGGLNAQLHFYVLVTALLSAFLPLLCLFSWSMTSQPVTSPHSSKATNFWTFRFKCTPHPLFLNSGKTVKCEAVPKSLLLKPAKPITLGGSSHYLNIRAVSEEHSSALHLLLWGSCSSKAW